MKDIFISYAREDAGFVDRLCAALRQRDVDAWVDLDGIYVGEEFWPQICSGIEESRCFCFVVSPHSAASKYCADELEHAAGLSKRILPLVREEPAGELPVLVACRHDGDQRPSNARTAPMTSSCSASLRSG